MTRHFADEIQEALDGRLERSALEQLESHRRDCHECSREYERLSALKERLRIARDTGPPPPDLEARIRLALDAEDRATRPVRSISPRLRRMRSLLALPATRAAAVLLLVLAAGTWVLRSVQAPDPARAVVEHLEQIRDGEPLALQTRDVTALESFFRASSPGFEARVLDLGMQGFELVGGRLDPVASRPSVLVAYRGTSGQLVLCEMFLGSANKARHGAEVRRERGIEFFLHRAGRTTVVFWQEGRVTCALASDGDPEALFRLAVAKAILRG